MRSIGIPLVISTTTTVTLNADGSKTYKIGAGQRFYKNDAGQWADVDFNHSVKVGEDYLFEKLPENATRKVFGDHVGYRISKWIGDEEFWVECHGPVATLASKDRALVTYETKDGLSIQMLGTRTRLRRLIPLATAETAKPAFRWAHSPNLVLKDDDPKVSYYWVNVQTKAVMFSMELPVAWSQSDVQMRDMRVGDASIDANGIETIDINLSGLRYPIIIGAA